MRHGIRHVAEAGKRPGRKESVARDHAAQQQMMRIGDEDEEHAEHGEEGAADGALLCQQRVEDLRRREAELQRDDRAGSFPLPGLFCRESHY